MTIALQRANDWLIKSGRFSDQRIKAPPFFSLTLKPWTKQWPYYRVRSFIQPYLHSSVWWLLEVGFQRPRL